MEHNPLFELLQVHFVSLGVLVEDYFCSDFDLVAERSRKQTSLSRIISLMQCLRQVNGLQLFLRILPCLNFLELVIDVFNGGKMESSFLRSVSDFQVVGTVWNSPPVGVCRAVHHIVRGKELKHRNDGLDVFLRQVVEHLLKLALLDESIVIEVVEFEQIEDLGVLVLLHELGNSLQKLLEGNGIGAVVVEEEVESLVPKPLFSRPWW